MNYLGEKWPVISTESCDFHAYTFGFFYMPQICDMGETALLLFRRKAVLRIFSLWKIRRLRPGLNRRTWVTMAGTLPLDHRSRLNECVSKVFITLIDMKFWRIVLLFHVVRLPCYQLTVRLFQRNAFIISNKYLFFRNISPTCFGQCRLLGGEFHYQKNTFMIKTFYCKLTLFMHVFDGVLSYWFFIFKFIIARIGCLSGCSYQCLHVT